MSGADLWSRWSRVVQPATSRQAPPAPGDDAAVASVPAERAALLACALSDQDRAASVLDQALPAVTDWRGLRDDALHHGVIALLYKRIVDSGATAVPPAELAALRALATANQHRSLRMSVQLLRVLALLSAAGLDVLPVKGPVMAEALYGDAGLRHCADIDVAVRPRDVAAARDALSAAGFRQATCVGIEIGRLLSSECEFSLRSADGELIVDLHWRLGPRFAPASLPVDDLIAHARETRFLDRDILVLSRPDLFIAMCVHGAHNHRWDQLELVAALGAWAAAAAPSDWQPLLDRAAGLGCLRRCTIGCLLMRDVAGVVLPATVQARLARDTLAARLARAARERLLARGPQTTGDDGLGGIVWESLSLDRPAMMARHFVARVVTPGTWDWQSRRVPSRLPALYYLSRPVRLASRYLRRGGAS